MSVNSASPRLRSASRPGAVRAWVMAARPATLTAAVVPVLVGSAVAYALGGFRWDAAVAALLGAVFIQIGTNFANDVFDHDKGADTEARLGPTRAVASGLITPSAMRFGMAIAFGLSLLSGVYLTYVAGYVVVIIGIASILSGIAYTGGPFPLGYNGLGDVFVMVFFGFVAVCGTTFVQLGEAPPLAVAASVPVGALITNILVVNNVRDRDTDREANKRTLAVRFGRRAGVAEYVVLAFSAYAVPVGLFLGGGNAWVLLPLASLPFAIHLAHRLARDEGAALNQTLVGSAKLVVLHGVPFAAGLAVGGA